MKKEMIRKFSKSEQFQHENKTWERLLEFFKQENTFLKNRLSEVVDITTDKEFLTLAEQFQSLFITKDEYIEDLRRDISDQEIMLKNLLSNSGENADAKLIKKQEKLRNEMEYLEKNFSKDKK